MARRNRQIAYTIILIVLLFTPLGLSWYKLFLLDYSFADLIPAVGYRVDLSMQIDGHGSDITLATYLPKTDYRQVVSEEENAAPGFTFSLENQHLNRRATWQAENVTGHRTLRYSYTIRAKHVQYRLPEILPLPSSYPENLSRYLREEEGIQVNDPLIDATLARILGNDRSNMTQILRAIHRYLQDEFANKKFSGFTDALTALKLKEGSCNGKSRLFIALLRRLGIPSRLVGGLILTPGSKRTSHQWIEAYINDQWVPFDTINDHFAELPAHYITLYYGDLSLFRHTTNINFQYQFKILKKLLPKREILAQLDRADYNILDMYGIFEKIGISHNLLKIILMIPFGALVVVFFRNVVGVETFGTFLPALIAAASRETGLLWGLVGFVLVIVTVALLRRLLDWLQLLHSPKMAILLTVVVLIMLSITAISVSYGNIDLAHMTLFPIAILAITAERFAIVATEQGTCKALTITATTAVVIAACYTVMDSLFLQSAVLAFPEILLVLIGLNLWFGKWIGIRLVELIRFRHLIFKDMRP